MKAECQDVIDMVTLLPPTPSYALVSGGKDSFAACDVVARAGLLKGCVLIDTGIAVPTWQEDVVGLCERFGWPYEIVPTPVRFEWFVWKYGFPGPAMHHEIMCYLKGRAIREWKKWHKNECLVSGTRIEESNRRGWSCKWESKWEGVTIYAPVLNWSTQDAIAYGVKRAYQKPRAYYTLGISGDCVCGAFATQHEPEAITEHYPALAERIARMKSRDAYTWGQRAIDKIDKTLPMFNDDTEAMAIACSDCWRGV